MFNCYFLHYNVRLFCVYPTRLGKQGRINDHKFPSCSNLMLTLWKRGPWERHAPRNPKMGKKEVGTSSVCLAPCFDFSIDTLCVKHGVKSCVDLWVTVQTYQSMILAFFSSNSKEQSITRTRDYHLIVLKRLYFTACVCLCNSRCEWVDREIILYYKQHVYLKLLLTLQPKQFRRTELLLLRLHQQHLSCCCLRRWGKSWYCLVSEQVRVCCTLFLTESCPPTIQLKACAQIS